MARQLGAGVSRIVIDAGHGGKDPGTHSGSLREKDIALDIAKRLRDDLTERGFEVIMTRDTDVFIPLEQRAFIANSREADLFVSIHVNAARNRRARGLETFYLNLATSPDAIEVAARENAATGKVRMADVDNLLKQILNHTWKEESREFATTIQARMVESILGRAKHPQNRGVKTAGFHVLLGAKMPAVLVEVGFVSNREEARQLRSASHRKKIAAAIADGIIGYTETLGQVVTTHGRQERRTLRGPPASTAATPLGSAGFQPASTAERRSMPHTLPTPHSRSRRGTPPSGTAHTAWNAGFSRHPRPERAAEPHHLTPPQQQKPSQQRHSLPRIPIDGAWRCEALVLGVSSGALQVRVWQTNAERTTMSPCFLTSRIRSRPCSPN